MVEQEDQVWVVRDKVTKKHWVSSSGKGSWNKLRDAKSAWKLKNGGVFDNQDKYEVVNLLDFRSEILRFLGEVEEYLPEYKDELMATYNNLMSELAQE